MAEPSRHLWFRRAARAAAVVAFVVVVVGAWVRLTAAGLGCPDWPGCYGHLNPAGAAADAASIAGLSPGRSFDYGKALREMQHRYLATTLGLLIIAVLTLAFVNRRDPEQPRRLPVLLFLLVCVQGLLGRLTVTGLVNPSIVTLHLAGGLTTLAILTWLAWERPRALNATERRLRPLAVWALVVLGLQILLGGWTSSNYAGPACPDFPTCQGALLPPMDLARGFQLWPGLGPDYEGGRLPSAARVAIQITHRLGAIVAGLLLVSVGTAAALKASGVRRLLGFAVASATAAQWIIGMNLIWQGFPLWLGTLHNACAALILVATLSLVRALSAREARSPAQARAC